MLLKRIGELVAQGSQFLIATHSPILMGYPNALLYLLSSRGIEPIEYEAVEHVRIAKDFLENRETVLRDLGLPSTARQR